MSKLFAFPESRSPRGTPRLCWREDLTITSESLWGRINKLMALNRICGKDIHGFIRNTSLSPRRSYSRSWQSGETRIAKPYSVSFLRKLFRLRPREGIGTIGEYIPLAETYRELLLFWSSDFLSYCPICMQHGVHTTYFQFTFINECPIHGVPLIHNCNKCGSPISTTTWFLNRSKPFSCKCGHCLWDWATTPVPSSELAILSNKHAHESQKIKKLCKELNFLCHSRYSLTTPDTTDPYSILRLINSLLSCSSNKSGRLELPNGANGSRFTIIRHLETKTSYSKSLPAEERLNPIYKSIARHIYRRTLAKYRAAIRTVCFVSVDQVSKSGHGAVELQVSMSSGAIGFVLWKMFWENLQSASECYQPRRLKSADMIGDYANWKELLVLRYRQYFRSGPLVQLARTSTDLDNRLFAHACLSTLEEAIILAESSTISFKKGKRNYFRVTTAHIEGKFSPAVLSSSDQTGCSEYIIINPNSLHVEAVSSILKNHDRERDLRLIRKEMSPSNRKKKLLESVADSYTLGDRKALDSERSD